MVVPKESHKMFIDLKPKQIMFEANTQNILRRVCCSQSLQLTQNLLDLI